MIIRMRVGPRLLSRTDRIRRSSGTPPCLCFSLPGQKFRNSSNKKVTKPYRNITALRSEKALLTTS
jgi:hypothetical protein